MVPAPRVDLTDTQRFLDCLGGVDARFTFQTFDDSPAKRRALARILHGRFRDCRDALGDAAGVALDVEVAAPHEAVKATRNATRRPRKPKQPTKPPPDHRPSRCHGGASPSRAVVAHARWQASRLSRRG